MNHTISRVLIGAVVTLSLLWFPGCTKKHQTAMILAKDFVPAQTTEPITDPRASTYDQWYVKIEMRDGRKTDVPVDQAQWDSIKVGDQVKARYQEGKYTGTIWAVDINK